MADGAGYESALKWFFFLSSPDSCLRAGKSARITLERESWASSVVISSRIKESNRFLISLHLLDDKGCFLKTS